MSAMDLTLRRVNKRVVIAAIALVVLVGGMSYRQASANPVFLPLIIGVVFHAALGVATGIEMYDGAPSTSAAVGASALSVTIANPADAGASEGAVRVPTTTNAASAASIPVPAAPATATGTTACNYDGHGSAGAYIAFLNASRGAGPYCSEFQSVSETQSCSLTYKSQSLGQISETVNCGTGATQFAINGSGATTCPPGYTLSGSTCNLSDARQAVADNKQDLTRSGTTLSTSPTDQHAAVNAVLSTAYVSNDSADVSGISVSGQPRMVRTTAKADGGSEVKMITQKTDAAGQTYLEVRQYDVSPTGTISSATQSAATGSLAVNSGGTGYSVSGGTTPFSPGTGSGSAPGSGTGATDYARQGEAAAAASTIVSALTGPTVTAPAQGVLDGTKDAVAGLCDGPACGEGSALHPGTSWLPNLLPGSAVACEPIEFRGQINTGPAAGLDSTTSFDPCWMLEIVRGLFGWFFNIIGIVYIWRRFTNMYNGGGT